ncbi:MAG: CBS domain-containing protein [Turicibacter sp.]|nr:CBS domain-containing protein [Turicibacter sp.]
MTEQAGYLEFIESFNHIHKYLKKYTDSDDNVSFSDLLYKAKGHPMIHLYLDDLHLFRKLRNIIVHQTDDFEQLIAYPSDEVVERIKFIEQQLVDPSTVSVFKAEVVKFNATDSITEVLKLSGEKEILKLPIYENDKFVGLVTSRAIAKWLQKHIENNTIELSGSVKDLLDYEKKSQYEFVAQLMTVYDAWHLFQSSPKKLDALLLTESGRQEDQIEAVITYDDVLKYIYTHDQYVFN